MQVKLTKREIELIMEAIDSYQTYLSQDDDIHEEVFELSGIYFKLKDINGQQAQ